MLDALRNNKRRQYRVEPESPPFEISMVLPNMRLLAGETLNVSTNGIALSFPRKKCPDMDVSAEVMLQLSLPRTSEAIMLQAVVRGSSDYEKRRLLRLQFVNA
ncbi:unnamed protein product, partial [marine sediment metagenome]